MLLEEKVQEVCGLLYFETLFDGKYSTSWLNAIYTTSPQCHATMFLFDSLPIDTLFIALTDEFPRSPQHNLYVIERHHEDLDTRRHFSPFSC